MGGVILFLKFTFRKKEFELNCFIKINVKG